MEAAVMEGTSINGISGKTPFAALEGVDFILALLPEYMHSCCQGVIKQFIKLWISPQHHKKPWYITPRNLVVINKRLSECCPPYDVTRTRFDLNDLPNWKASMFKAFALYYFVVFEGYLEPQYFAHFSKLSYCLFVLLQEEVSVENVKNVETLLKSFVLEAEELYGVEELGVNVHFLTHLAQAVLNWGCLWTTSTFIPEWFNGELLSLKNGTQFVADQMCRNYVMKMIVRRDAFELLSKFSLPRQVSTTLIDLLRIPSHLVDRSSNKGLAVNGGLIILLGTATHRKIAIDEKVALLNYVSSSPKLQAIVNSIINLESCSVFPRFRIGKSRSIFTTCSYTRSKKRINYYTLLSDGVFLAIETIMLTDTPVPHVFIFGQEMGSFSRSPYFEYS